MSSHQVEGTHKAIQELDWMSIFTSSINLDIKADD